MSTPVTPTRDCRMLAAAQAAYYIDGSGNFNPPSGNAIYNAIQWTSQPVPVFGTSGLEDEDLNACLVGKTANDGVVVSFRGTLPITSPPTFEEILDWLQDFLMTPYSNDPIITGWGSGVAVHAGFWDAIQSIWSGVNTQIQNLKPTAGNFFFTGHSKGGPLASLGAMLWATANPSGPLPGIYTFASPRPGNAAFASAFANAGVTQTRYENTNDMVPLLPPSSSDVSSLTFAIKIAVALGKIDKVWGNVAIALLNTIGSWNYSTVGTGYLIGPSGSLSPADSAAQWGTVLATLTSGGDALETIAAAHCAACPASACQGGYMTGVCGSTGLCP